MYQLSLRSLTPESYHCNTAEKGPGMEQITGQILSLSSLSLCSPDADKQPRQVLRLGSYQVNHIYILQLAWKNFAAHFA